MEPKLKLAKRLNFWAWIISAIVLALVGAMRRIKLDLPEGVDLSVLPSINAVLNSLTALVLIYAFVQIKKKNIDLHRKAIFLALGLSTVFLICYVVYHITSGEVIFGDLNHDGSLDDQEMGKIAGLRPFYLVLLFSHIILAGLIFPFILFTFIRGFTFQVERHKKMARWVFPLWLYVAISGPIVYLMLRPYY